MLISNSINLCKICVPELELTVFESWPLPSLLSIVTIDVCREDVTISVLNSGLIGLNLYFTGLFASELLLDAGIETSSVQCAFGLESEAFVSSRTRWSFSDDALLFLDESDSDEQLDECSLDESRRLRCIPLLRLSSIRYTAGTSCSHFSRNLLTALRPLLRG